MDIVTLQLAKKYAADTMAGAGAIKGDKGDPGPAGPIGPQGEQGPKGDPGEPGGVTSFNGRAGAVAPASGDYTAEMVGAATMEQVNAAISAAVTGAIEEAY